MAAYDLEEQEQLAEIKAWWKRWGNLVTGVVTALALGVLAWQAWGWHQARQAAGASGVYAVLQRAALERDMQKTKTAAGELIEKFGGTAYAPLGALIAAKSFYDAGDLKSAKAQLAWVAENGKDELRDLGRLRLAAVLLDEQAYDEALKVLASSHEPAFDTRYAEMRGDVFIAQGRREEAAAAYREALAGLERNAQGQGNTLQAREMNAPYREMVQLKLDATGVAK
ncbi:MAG: tetratricopeptide repeat protein [Azospira sp.]|jgi:predicted negative regulator of RcsB-dependent stress response|nr:tetratricopeptide repeat protein [Azospira sp.]